MSIEAAFDIQQMKNSSKRQRNALQVEWQETSMTANSSDTCALLADLCLDDEKFPSMLPNVVLALNYRNRMPQSQNLGAANKQVAQSPATNIVHGLSSSVVADWTH